MKFSINIEQIIANAPEGATHYYVYPCGQIVYYKNGTDKGFEYSWGDIWKSGAENWNEATPLPKPKYSAENPPPHGWFGEVNFGNSQWYEAFSHDGKIYPKGFSLVTQKIKEFREIQTPRERFIEQAQQEGADFGAIYDEFVGGEV